MNKLAFEAQLTAEKFNDASTCLGIVRQMLAAIRAQMRDQNAIRGSLTLSILVTSREPETIEMIQDQNQSWMQ